MVSSITQRIAEFHRRNGAVIGDDDEIHVKHTVLKGTSVDRDQRLVSGTITTTTADLDNEVILPKGLDLGYFNKTKAVYLDHFYGDGSGVAAVGTCRRIAPRRDGSALFATTFVTRRAIGDDILTAIEEEAIRGLSVGLRAIEAGPPNDDEQTKYGRVDTVIRRGLLLEYSFTSMPCNPDALVELVSKGRIKRHNAVLLGMPDTPKRKHHPVNVTIGPDGIIISKRNGSPSR